MKRSYQQYCGLARALDLVGERWTLLVVRELLLGPKRFGELLQRLNGLSTNLLTSRLKEMVAQGLLEKRGRVYELTEFGWKLEPVLFAFAQWGSQTMAEGPRPDEMTDLSWYLLSRTRHYLGGLDMTAEVRCEGRCFELRFTPERLYVRERPASGAIVVAQVEGLMPLAEAIAAKDSEHPSVHIQGESQAWRQILDSF